jgi:hypothetical protein
MTKQGPLEMVISQFGPQSISFNGIVDLPIGRGKKFLGTSNRFVDELPGGYQIAWNGSVFRNWMGISSSNWGGSNPTNQGSMSKAKVHKHKYKVNDCSSGVCLPVISGTTGTFSIADQQSLRRGHGDYRLICPRTHYP